jgi:pheromone shutdown-related protein TraB
MENNIDILNIDGRKIKLIGTAHISKESVLLVEKVIKEEKPDTVCVELCNSRYKSIKQGNKWQDTDIIKVIKEKKVFLLLSNLMLQSFQKKIAAKFDIKPGAEIIKAISSAKETGSQIHLIDRDVRVTLSKIWRTISFWEKIKVLYQLITSMGGPGDISKEDIENMKKSDVIESVLKDVGKSHPILKKILIDERDRFLAEKIKTAPGENIVAVVGAGHVPGIKKHINETQDIDELNYIPEKSRFSKSIKWLIPIAIIGIFLVGFLHKDASAGKDMLMCWIIANGVFAGIGSLIAMAHPYAILSSIIAAPLTSLNPMLAAGWVSGLVEAFMRKPKVKDFESLSEDILSIKGFWKNKVTRILLVVVFTNIGSGIGTMAALPILLNILGR